MAVSNVSATRGGSVTDIVGSAWRDAYALMQTRINIYYILIAVGTVLALLAAVANPNAVESGSIVSLVAGYYAVAAAIRTVRPDFRWTIEKILMLFVWGLVVWILVMIGLALLVIPGIFIAVRLCMTYYSYLMPESAENPLVDSWHLTAHHFWTTFAMVALVTVISGVVSFAVSLILGLLGHFSPFLGAILTIPELYVDFWLINFAVLANVRWFVHLRQARTMTTVPA